MATKKKVDGEGSGGPLEPLVVNSTGLARLLGVSKASVERLHAGAQLPRPVRLGRCVRWPVAEIQAWLAAGGPDRKTWAATERSR